jgi:cytochrome bd-type quinol oxidase subunit 2
MYRITAYFASLEVAGLLGFIIMSRYQEGVLSHFLPLLVVLVAIGSITFLKARALSYREIAFVSVVASMIFILVVQLLGFTVYPGLAKDIDFISGENAARTGVMLFFGTVGHFLLLTLARIAN